MREGAAELDGPPVGRRLPALLRSPNTLAVLGYVVLTVWVMWPAVRGFRRHALADDVDGAVFTWIWGWMPDAVGAGRDPLTTDVLFHPQGADLRLTTSAPLVAALTWPIREALGVAAQVNTVQLASTFLAGLATYFLARRVCRHPGAAFLAGVGYALLPSRMFHAHGHLNLVETAVIPFGLLLLLRFTEVPNGRRAAAVGATLGGAFLIDPQLTILLVVGMVCVAVPRWRMLVEHVRKLAGAAVLAGLVAAPLLVPMAVALTAGEGGHVDPTSTTVVYSASPFSWVVPPLDRLWIGRFASLEPLTPTAEGVVYPGLVLGALALAGTALTESRRRRGWVSMAVISIVMSFGPYLFVRGRLLEIPLPFFAVRAVPGLEAFRVPGRFGLLGALAIAVLAAAALADLARRRPRQATVLLVMAVAVTTVELFPRELPVRERGVPEVYEVIADDPAPGAVLEVPLKWSTGQEDFGFEGHDQDFRFLLYQMVHQKPGVSGAVSRYPDDDLEQLLSTPVYRQLLALGGEEGFDDRATFGRQDLAAQGIDFVVYHRDDPAPDALRYLQGLDLPVLADDGTVIVWKVAR